MTALGKPFTFEQLRAFIIAHDQYFFPSELPAIFSYLQWGGAPVQDQLIAEIDKIIPREPDIRADMTVCGVDKKELAARLTDFPKEIREAAEYWLCQGNVWLYLYGPPGTGKTWLAAALLREIVLRTPKKIHYEDMRFTNVRGPLPQFITAVKLIKTIRAAYSSRKTTEKDIIERYSTVDTLIIDDLSVVNSSETTYQDLYEIINARSSNGRMTIITDNLSLESLKQRFDDRIASRIYGMCKPSDKLILQLQGEDKRAPRRQLL